MRPGRWLLYAVLAAFAVFFLLPLVVVILNSFRTAQEIARTLVIGWPLGLAWQNYGARPGAATASPSAAKASSPTW